MSNWAAEYAKGVAQLAGPAGKRVLVVYAEDHRNFPAVVSALSEQGCTVKILAPRWARPHKLPAAPLADLQEAAAKPEAALGPADLLFLPSVPQNLVYRLGSTGEESDLVNVLRSARRLGKPVVAISDASQTEKLRSLGIAAISAFPGTGNELDMPSCDACPTHSSCASKCTYKLQDLVLSGASRLGGGDGGPPASRNLARMIDHTLLKQDATEAEVKKLCDEARQHQFMSVCVNPTWVAFAAKQLQGSGVKVCTVIGFPLGATDSATKEFETIETIRNGADEVDMVINVGALKSKNYELVENDIRAVIDAAKRTRKDVVTKVILETALLTDEEKVIGCALSKSAGADFVKTSTGFSTGGATVRDIALMRATVGPQLGVKASGGVRDTKTAQDLVAAGATRIGASASVAIVKGTAASGSGY
jgi:deoxyribose-phosphate aldolase